PTATWTWIISADTFFFHKWFSALFLIFLVITRNRLGIFGNLLTLQVFAYLCFHDIFSDFLFNRGNHFLEHLKAFRLILLQRIVLAVCQQLNTLTQLIHFVYMIHPFRVHCTSKYYFFELMHLIFSKFLFFHYIVP